MTFKWDPEQSKGFRIIKQKVNEYVLSLYLTQMLFTRRRFKHEAGSDITTNSIRELPMA